MNNGNENIMGDYEIRINKRTIERGLLLIIIIALAVMLFLKWEPAIDNQEITRLQTEIDTLRTNNQELQTRITTLEAEPEPEETPTTPTPTTPEPEPEPTLSGIIDYRWVIRTDLEGRLTTITITIDNEKAAAERIFYKVFWKNFYEETVFMRDDVTIKSGERETIVLDPTELGFSRSPPSDITTLRVEFRNSAGDLLETLEERVR